MHRRERCSRRCQLSVLDTIRRSVTVGRHGAAVQGSVRCGKACRGPARQCWAWQGEAWRRMSPRLPRRHALLIFIRSSNLRAAVLTRAAPELSLSVIPAQAGIQAILRLRTALGAPTASRSGVRGPLSVRGVNGGRRFAWIPACAGMTGGGAGRTGGGALRGICGCAVGRRPPLNLPPGWGETLGSIFSWSGGDSQNWAGFGFLRAQESRRSRGGEPPSAPRRPPEAAFEGR